MTCLRGLGAARCARTAAIATSLVMPYRSTTSCRLSPDGTSAPTVGQAMRTNFANDPRGLVTVEAASNQSKSSRGGNPKEQRRGWRPSNDTRSAFQDRAQTIRTQNVFDVALGATKPTKPLLRGRAARL